MSGASHFLAKLKRRQLGLAGVIVLQYIAAVFFVGDVVVDLMDEPLAEHSLIEMLVTLALVVGIGLNAVQLRRIMERVQAQERALDTARGDLARIIETQFETWCLTPDERDVGLLALKGLDAAEISETRGAAKGTARAQLTRIYAKVGVSGRAQFAAWFAENLLDTGLGTAGSNRRDTLQAPIQTDASTKSKPRPRRPSEACPAKLPLPPLLSRDTAAATGTEQMRRMAGRSAHSPKAIPSRLGSAPP